LSLGVSLISGLSRAKRHPEKYLAREQSAM
jgi:hypothetical protein